MLVAELVATYVDPAPTPGNKKRKLRPTFAYFVGEFSALHSLPDVDEVVKKFCLRGRLEAVELATSAVIYSRADTLGQTKKGIEALANAVMKHDHFPRHASAAMQAAREFNEQGQIELLKWQFRRKSTAILENMNIKPCEANDSARWREVFKAAGLQHLAQERKGRDV